MNSRRRKLLVDWTLYSFFALLLLPVIWYSLNTPFALIDDYGDWLILRTFSSVPGVLNWTQNLLFHFGAGRFRPVLDLYNYITWSAFSDNYSLHHLMRLLLKLFTVFFSIRVISLFTARENNKFNIAIFAFLSIYLFFPNTPEARLAPVELEVTFFLSILFYCIGKLFMQNNGDILLFYKKEYTILLIIFVLLSFTKETCLAFTCIALFFILSLNINKKGILKVLPVVILIMFIFFKAYYETRAGGYGTAPISYALIRNNFHWCLKYLFLYDTSKVFAVLFLLPIVCYLVMKIKDVRKRLKVSPTSLDRSSCFLTIAAKFQNMLLYDKELTFYTFLVSNFLAFFVVALTFWAPVLRYFHPLVYILSLLIGISFARIGTVSVHSRKVKAITIGFCLYFALGNYYNFIYQFAAQYSVRRTEQRMLSEVTQLLKRGGTVYNVIDGEYEDNIARYFNDYLPYFHGRDYRIRNVQRHDLFDENIYYVTRSNVSLPGHMTEEKKIIDEQDLFALKIARNISSFALLGKSPFYWADAGARRIGEYNWLIYRNYLKLDDHRDSASILYKSSECVRVIGGRPYAEHWVELPKTLKKNHVFIMRLQYYTIGNAAPFIIVIQIPFRHDNLPLHDRIPRSHTPKTIELPFSPSLDVPSPKILLRNTSPDGILVVEDIEVLEMVIDSDQPRPKGQ